MIDIGQLLRQTREAQELSLADVEAQTRIRQRYVSALESGDWDDMPNEVVARGFLRTYSQFLGLDPDEILSQLNVGRPEKDVPSQEQVPEDPAPAESSDYNPIELDLYEETLKRSQRILRGLGFALSLIPVIVLAYLIIQFGLPLLLGQGNDTTDNSAPVATLPPEGTPPSTPQIVIANNSTTVAPSASPTASATPATPSATAVPTFTPTLAPSPSPTPTRTAAEELVLDITVGQRSWVQVAADGVSVEERVLDTPFSAQYVAAQRMEFLTGNAAGVTLALNGEILPPLGEPGQIVALIWTISDGQVIASTPTPEPSEGPVEDVVPTLETPATETETPETPVDASSTPEGVSGE